jgi:hypothetical protein
MVFDFYFYFFIYLLNLLKLILLIYKEIKIRSFIYQFIFLEAYSELAILKIDNISKRIF